MLIEDKITAIFCVIDDVLKHTGYQEDIRRKVSDSEVITAAISSALFFYGNQERTLCYLKGSGLMPNMLEKSRFNRRVTAVSYWIYELFIQSGRYFKDFRCDMEYVIDSFPVPVCDNIRISRCKLLKGEQICQRQ